MNLKATIVRHNSTPAARRFLAYAEACIANSYFVIYKHVDGSLEIKNLKTNRRVSEREHAHQAIVSELNNLPEFK